jgi:EAL domain-containing protein (putative c-di-GMP-specific phosphodiesterase class I)
MDALKIDRSFVARMGIDARSTELVRTIVTMARNLGMDIIPEGVETVEQAGLLVEMGCRRAQGYLFSRPLPAEEVTGVLFRSLRPTSADAMR